MCIRIDCRCGKSTNNVDKMLHNAMGKSHILHVVNISFVIPYFLGNQLNWFTEKGNKEFIVCSNSEELKRFSEEFDFEYRAIDVLRKISIKKDISAVFKTAKYIREIKADVVTGHTPKGGLIAMLAAYITRVPVRIYFRHGLVYETSTGLKRVLLVNIDRLASRLATKIVCVSPSVAKRSLEDKINPASKQVVLANGTCNGIDVARFNIDSVDKERLAALKKNLGIGNGDFVIGFAGRLVKDKGIIELVRAYNTLRQQHKNVRLMLVGMLEIRDALPDDVVKVIQEDEGIIKTGYVNYTEIEYYYALMDVFVLASYREGFPTSVLEASAMNLPVITTRATGCIDSIIDGETGIFVNHDDKELLTALSTLYDNEDKRKMMGQNGRKFVVDHFKPEIIWREIEKLYQQ